LASSILSSKFVCSINFLFSYSAETHSRLTSCQMVARTRSLIESDFSISFTFLCSESISESVEQQSDGLFDSNYVGLSLEFIPSSDLSFSLNVPTQFPAARSQFVREGRTDDASHLFFSFVFLRSQDRCETQLLLCSCQFFRSDSFGLPSVFICSHGVSFSSDAPTDLRFTRSLIIAQTGTEAASHLHISSESLSSQALLESQTRQSRQLPRSDYSVLCSRLVSSIDISFSSNGPPRSQNARSQVMCWTRKAADSVSHISFPFRISGALSRTPIWGSHQLLHSKAIVPSFGFLSSVAISWSLSVPSQSPFTGSEIIGQTKPEIQSHLCLSFRSMRSQMISESGKRESGQFLPSDFAHASSRMICSMHFSFSLDPRTRSPFAPSEVLAETHREIRSQIGHSFRFVNSFAPSEVGAKMVHRALGARPLQRDKMKSLGRNDGRPDGRMEGRSFRSLQMVNHEIS
jgi:hypothetical protein